MMQGFLSPGARPHNRANVPCVAGGAVLGNGEVVLVLDVQQLEDSFRAKSKGRPALAAA